MELNKCEIEVLENALISKKGNLNTLKNGYKVMDTDPKDVTMKYYVKNRIDDLDSIISVIDGLLKKCGDEVI